MVQSRHQCKRSWTFERVLGLAAGALCAWNSASLAAKADEARHRAPVMPAEIVKTMEERQMPTRGVQVRLAAAITAAVQKPRLEIETVMPVSPRELRMRMACSDRSQCLPFFAIATYPEDVNPATLAIKPEHLVSVGDHPEPAAHAPSVSSGAAGQGVAPMLRSGSPATLGFDAERVHVRIAVICLESGGAGDKIRVTTRDRKQVYVAEIVAPTLLKGTF